MAAPSAPTLSGLVSEALSKAGYNSPASALTTRAETIWMEEIKNDLAIIFRGKELKFLYADRILTLTDGKVEYDEPTDFLSNISMTLMYGGEYGTAQAGGASSITLAADATLTSDNAPGREICIISGTGSNQSRTILSLSASVATVNSAWTTQPDNTSKYVIIDTYEELDQRPIWDYDCLGNPYYTGRPREYFPIGDEDNGRFKLYPVPKRNITNNAYIIKQRYYANLMKLDLAGTLISTLYQRWRNLWDQGIKAKAFDWDNDDRGPSEMQKYNAILGAIRESESYQNLNLTTGQVRSAF